MNDILNRGFVRPYIEFNFAAGSIDTDPPRYFMSFHQDRSTKEATQFELTLMYAPGMHGETEANFIHNILLSSVNQPVTYTYGYVTPGGGLHLQEVYYKGIFTSYSEDLNNGYLIYKIVGVGSEVENITPKCNIEAYLADEKQKDQKVQPSMLVEHAVKEIPHIADMFKDFRFEIQHTDEAVDIKSINVKNGTVREVFSGTYNADGTQTPTGFAYYSYQEFTPEQALASGLLSKSIANLANQYAFKASHGISSSISIEETSAYNEVNAIRRMPYVCYFDNVVDSKGSPMKGTFYYVPKYNRQVTNTYVYNFGNSFIDSDVLSFNASVDCTPAMATVGGLSNVSSDVDGRGNMIGTTYNEIQTTGWHKNTYNTLSGFNEGVFLTSTAVASAFNFPFEASMTVVGQTKVNYLLDRIRVTVILNGATDVLLTGEYVILGIEDDISDSGYTTTFRLLRDYGGVEAQQKYVNSERDHVAISVQKSYDNDWK